MRISKLTGALGALVLVAGAAAPAVAHHGWADYEPTDFQLTGVVVSANLGGPHGLLKVRSAGKTWDVVLAPPPAIARSGLTVGAVPVGATVTAKGHKHPSRLEMKTERLVVGKTTFDLYPNRS